MKKHVSVNTGTIYLLYVKVVRINYKLWVHLKAHERVFKCHFSTTDHRKMDILTQEKFFLTIVTFE